MKKFILALFIFCASDQASAILTSPLRFEQDGDTAYNNKNLILAIRYWKAAIGECNKVIMVLNAMTEHGQIAKVKVGKKTIKISEAIDKTLNHIVSIQEKISQASTELNDAEAPPKPASMLVFSNQ